MKYLIAGLGNIGAEYANTRHNIGFNVTDALARLSGVSFQSGRYADVTRVRIKNKSLVLIKPNTYMNLSGKAVRYWLETEKIPLENLLVVVDDIALPPGQLRLKLKGGDGGHNGLSSIIETLGTEEFARLRFGIGSDFAKGYQVEYVLGKWTAEEESVIIPKIADAVEMIKSFVMEGAEITMTKFNR
jgi:peptidyl-tRNA hydrolase, PTH1 family